MARTRDGGWGCPLSLVSFFGPHPCPSIQLPLASLSANGTAGACKYEEDKDIVDNQDRLNLSRRWIDHN